MGRHIGVREPQQLTGGTNSVAGKRPEARLRSVRSQIVMRLTSVFVSFDTNSKKTKQNKKKLFDFRTVVSREGESQVQIHSSRLLKRLGDKGMTM